MKIGIHTNVTDQGIDPQTLGREVEARGFESLFVGEHTHVPAGGRYRDPELPDMFARFLDPFVALTAAGLATERLLIATGLPDQ